MFYKGNKISLASQEMARMKGFWGSPSKITRAVIAPELLYSVCRKGDVVVVVRDDDSSAIRRSGDVVMNHLPIQKAKKLQSEIINQIKNF